MKKNETGKERKTESEVKKREKFVSSGRRNWAGRKDESDVTFVGVFLGQWINLCF